MASQYSSTYLGIYFSNMKNFYDTIYNLSISLDPLQLLQKFLLILYPNEETKDFVIPLMGSRQNMDIDK